METPKRPLNNAESKNSSVDQDETINSSASKRFADEDDDLDMPLDDVAYEDYDDFDDEDDF